MTLTKKDLKEMIEASEKRIIKKISSTDSKISLLEEKMDEQTKVLETSFRNLLKFETGKTNERIDQLTQSVAEAFIRTEKRFENIELKMHHPEPI